MTHRGQLSFDRLDALVDADDRFDLAAIKKIAAEADASAFLDSRLDLGGAIGISATPTYVINGKVVEGARGLETLQRTIANAEAEME